jgi:uncharacterized protein YeeX (DUF496 family)
VKIHGITSISEFVDDFIVYRNLNPVDPRLPRLSGIRPLINLDSRYTPRKSEPAYGHVIAHLLNLARQINLPGTKINRIVYIGDTQMNDGNAFRNICAAANVNGAAFIGSENDSPPAVQISGDQNHPIYAANRWQMLSNFVEYCEAQNIEINEETALVLDLDKTALGARGRNDKVIDRIRMKSARDTLEAALGNKFNLTTFEEIYHNFNQTKFHPFTTDNQDYLVYLCLVILSGLVSKEALQQQIQSQSEFSFEQFVNAVDRNSSQLSENIRDIHKTFIDALKDQDPTPFKAFRRTEYLNTIEAMQIHSPNEDLIADYLEHNITITQEVRETALKFKEAGSIVFALSDKPDEASLPQSEDRISGKNPIHRTQALAISA